MKANPWAWALGALVLVIIVIAVALFLRSHAHDPIIRPGNQCGEDADCKGKNYYCEGGWCVLKRGPS
jgi:hypothetical protein